MTTGSEDAQIEAIKAARNAVFGPGYAGMRDAQNEFLLQAQQLIGTMNQRSSEAGDTQSEQAQVQSAISMLLMIISTQATRIEALESRVTLLLQR